MVERGSGTIVHVTSIQRRAPLPTSIPYAAAKAALTNYSKALANELAPNGIRVNAVCPGFIETESARKMAEEISRINGISLDEARAQIVESIGGIPLGAPGSPADVGELVAFLVSNVRPHHRQRVRHRRRERARRLTTGWDRVECLELAVLDLVPDGADAGRTARSSRRAAIGTARPRCRCRLS